MDALFLAIQVVLVLLVAIIISTTTAMIITINCRRCRPGRPGQLRERKLALECVHEGFVNSDKKRQRHAAVHEKELQAKLLKAPVELLSLIAVI